MSIESTWTNDVSTIQALVDVRKLFANGYYEKPVLKHIYYNDLLPGPNYFPLEEDALRRTVDQTSIYYYLSTSYTSTAHVYQPETLIDCDYPPFKAFYCLFNNTDYKISGKIIIQLTFHTRAKLPVQLCLDSTKLISGFKKSSPSANGVDLVFNRPFTVLSRSILKIELEFDTRQYEFNNKFLLRSSFALQGLILTTETDGFNSEVTFFIKNNTLKNIELGDRFIQYVILDNQELIEAPWIDFKKQPREAKPFSQKSIATDISTILTEFNQLILDIFRDQCGCKTQTLGFQSKSTWFDQNTFKPFIDKYCFKLRLDDGKQRTTDSLDRFFERIKNLYARVFDFLTAKWCPTLDISTVLPKIDHFCKPNDLVFKKLNMFEGFIMESKTTALHNKLAEPKHESSSYSPKGKCGIFEGAFIFRYEREMEDGTKTSLLQSFNHMAKVIHFCSLIRLWTQNNFNEYYLDRGFMSCNLFDHFYEDDTLAPYGYQYFNAVTWLFYLFGGRVIDVDFFIRISPETLFENKPGDEDRQYERCFYKHETNLLHKRRRFYALLEEGYNAVTQAHSRWIGPVTTKLQFHLPPEEDIVALKEEEIVRTNKKNALHVRRSKRLHEKKIEDEKRQIVANYQTLWKRRQLIWTAKNNIKNKIQNDFFKSL